MNNQNEEKIQKARQFCKDVEELAKKYHLPFFIVTDGASVTSNNDCAAIKNARDSHIEWEKANGYDPYEDWSKKMQ